MVSDKKKAKVEAAMQKKYPQMYGKDGKLKPKYRKKKANWASKLGDLVGKHFASKKAGKPSRSSRGKTIEKRTGLSESELKRLR